MTHEPRLSISDDRPLVSILIPTYNRRIMLERALDSARSQSYENCEIIVSDNCSTDETFSFLKSYQGKCRNLYIHKTEKNIGPLHNLLNALNNARGVYAYFLADDDFLREDCISDLLPQLSCPNVCHSTSFVTEVNPKGVITGVHKFPHLVGNDDLEFLLSLSDFRENSKLAVLTYGLTRIEVLREACMYPPFHLGRGNSTYIGTELIFLRRLLKCGAIALQPTRSITYTGPGERQGAQSYSMIESTQLSGLGWYIVLQQFYWLFVANAVDTRPIAQKIRLNLLLTWSFLIMLARKILARIPLLTRRN